MLPHRGSFMSSGAETSHVTFRPGSAAAWSAAAGSQAPPPRDYGKTNSPAKWISTERVAPPASCATRVTMSPEMHMA